VPFDFAGCGVAVELLADVAETLDRGDVGVVDRGPVEDDGVQDGAVVFDGGLLAAAGAGVVPWAVLLEDFVSIW